MKHSTRLIRPLVRTLQSYVPGEQPKGRGLIKLNTNENPYPPSPKVLNAIKATVDARLRLYPNPSAEGLRSRLAKLHHCNPKNIIIGNGSDELLALATRAFVEPVSADPRQSAAQRSRENRGRVRTFTSAATVQYFTPSYSLYPVLATIQGASQNPVPLKKDFSLPPPHELKQDAQWDFGAALTFITTPNAPSGRGYGTAELDALCRLMKGVVVLDEAYVDFSAENAMALARKYPHVIVARTFSKAYSLCFQRIGYFIGQPELIGALHRIRDSYNVNGLGQVAAEATLKDLPHYRRNFKTIIETRKETGLRLAELGFDVLPSQTNFLLVRPHGPAARSWMKKLRDRRILVRWFDTPELRNYLRITIGTPAEMERLLQEISRILNAKA